MFSFLDNRPKSPRRRRTLLELQEFGQRIVPAGLIEVTLQNGTLKVMGDANANTLTVTQTIDHRLTLTTDIGAGLRVNGTDVTGFTGFTLATPVTGGVTVNLGDGPDSLTISGQVEDINLPSSLAINGGDGSNLVTFLQGVTVGGDVTITNGNGMDTTHLNDEMNFLGKLTINNGKGGSLLDNNATTDLRVGGVFSVTSGAGFDKFNTEAAQKVRLGGFNLNTGTDTDGSDTDLSPAQDLTVHGSVTVTNGAGNDLLDIGDPTLATKITGAVVIKNGAGTNHTDIFGTDTLFVGGPITTTGGADSDLVHLGVNSNLVSFGAITVNNGAGSNSTIVAGTALDVSGNLTVTGGAGTDTLSVLSTADATITGAVKATLGKGQNTLEMRAGNDATMTIGKTLKFLSASQTGFADSVVMQDVTVQGTAMIATGAGNDTIDIDDTTFNAAFTLNTAAGADSVKIERKSACTGHTVFNKPAVITTGAGDDSLSISGVLAEPERKAIFGSIAKFDGGAGTDTLQLSDFGANIFNGPPPVKIGF